MWFMRYRWIWPILLLAAVLVAGVMTLRKEDRPFIRGREAWIRRQIPALLQFRPEEDTKPVPVRIYEHRGARVQGPEGWIKLKGDEWIYFTSCSSHNQKVADVVLAVDHAGNLYTSNSHVCSDLHLYWPRLTGRRNLETVEDFISSVAAPQRLRGRWSPWVEVNEWKTSPPGAALPKR
jgi:hypothetical protein